MGYTNYFNTKKTITADARAKMVTFVNKAITLIPDIKICGWDGTGEPTITKESIMFNGDEAEGLDHETFSLYGDCGKFNFTKTARKPYDILVKAVLMYATDLNMLSKKEPWDFDGYKHESEYVEAQKLYLQTLHDIAL